MEIERKFLIKNIPDNLDNNKSYEIEQAYLADSPVVRIRKRVSEKCQRSKKHSYIRRYDRQYII